MLFLPDERVMVGNAPRPELPDEPDERPWGSKLLEGCAMVAGLAIVAMIIGGFILASLLGWDFFK